MVVPMNAAQGAMAQQAGQNQGGLPPQMQQAIQAKMQDPKFMQWFNSLPPEQQQAALQRLAMDYSGEGNVADEQLTAAQMLRGADMPEGRQAGRVYVAANPLEHIGAAYKQREGLRQQEEALARKKELSEMQTQGLQDVMASQLRDY